MKGNPRRFGRFDTTLKAYYITGEMETERQDCTVINMSRKGIGVKFHTRDNISIGTPVRLEVIIPEKSSPAMVKGILKWTEERGDEIFGGIECVELLDEMKFSKNE